MRSLQIILALVAIAVLGSGSLPANGQGKDPDPVGLRPDAPDYAKHGSFWVGVREFTIPDKDNNRPLPLTIWYPALNDTGSTNYAIYDLGITDLISKEASLIKGGHALANAQPALTKAPYPLVVISHGLGGSRYLYYILAEHLASYGFVVAAVDHVGTTIREYIQKTADLGSQNDITSLYYRPSDIVRTIAYADTLTATGGPLAGLIDTKNVAVWGHSTGGTTAFQAAGARIDLTALKTWCADKQADKWAAESCQFLDHKNELATLYGVSNPDTGLFPALWDTRVRAVVAAAPGGELHAFGTTGIAAVQVPTLIMFGTADPSVFPTYNALWAYDQIGSSNKSLLTFDNGGHLMFGNCPPLFKDLCNDAVWDVDRVHDLTDHFTTAFLLDVLKGDKDAHKVLLPDAVEFSGIEYKTTMK